MGSVVSEIKCPKCKWKKATEECYYKIDELFVFCDRCGYTYNRKAKFKNGEFSNYKESKVGGYGAYRYGSKGAYACGGLPRKELNRFVKWAKRNKRKFDEIYITKKMPKIGWVEMDLLSGTSVPMPNNFHIKIK